MSRFHRHVQLPDCQTPPVLLTANHVDVENGTALSENENPAMSSAAEPNFAQRDVPTREERTACREALY